MIHWLGARDVAQITVIFKELFYITYSIHNNVMQHGFSAVQNTVFFIALIPSQFIVQVMCRFRPLNPSEKERGDDFLPKFPSTEQVTFGHPVRNMRI